MSIVWFSGCSGEEDGGTSGADAADRVSAPSAEEIESSLVAAERYFDGGEFVKAEVILRELLAQVPGNVSGNEMLARVLFHKAEQAREEGRTRVAETLFDDAYAWYETVVELEPNHAGWRQNAGDFALVAGQPDAAVRHYRRAGELDPTNPRHPLYEAQVLLQEGRVDEADRAIERALELQPSSAHAIATRAAILMERDQVDEALAHIRRARSVARAADQLTFRVMEARFLRMNDNPDGSIMLLATLDPKAKATEAATRELALAYRAVGDLDRARATWINRYEQTGAWSAAASAADVLLDEGRLDEAANWIRIAHSIVGEHERIASLTRRLQQARDAGGTRANGTSG